MDILLRPLYLNHVLNDSKPPENLSNLHDNPISA
jgi:hypothetical protein